jgi:hypothetical protein
VNEHWHADPPRILPQRGLTAWDEPTPPAAVVATGVRRCRPTGAAPCVPTRVVPGGACSALRRDEPLTEVLDRLPGGTRIAVVVGGELAGLLPRAERLRRTGLRWRLGDPAAVAWLTRTGAAKTAGALAGRSAAGAAACGIPSGLRAHAVLPRSGTSVVGVARRCSFTPRSRGPRACGMTTQAVARAPTAPLVIAFITGQPTGLGTADQHPGHPVRAELSTGTAKECGLSGV